MIENRFPLRIMDAKNVKNEPFSCRDSVFERKVSNCFLFVLQFLTGCHFTEIQLYQSHFLLFEQL